MPHVKRSHTSEYNSLERDPCKYLQNTRDDAGNRHRIMQYVANASTLDDRSSHANVTTLTCGGSIGPRMPCCAIIYSGGDTRFNNVSKISSTNFNQYYTSGTLQDAGRLERKRDAHAGRSTTSRRQAVRQPGRALRPMVAAANTGHVIQVSGHRPCLIPLPFLST